jgi:hypothetical protein
VKQRLSVYDNVFETHTIKQTESVEATLLPLPQRPAKNIML